MDGIMKRRFKLKNKIEFTISTSYNIPVKYIKG